MKLGNIKSRGTSGKSGWKSGLKSLSKSLLKQGKGALKSGASTLLGNLSRKLSDEDDDFDDVDAELLEDPQEQLARKKLIPLSGAQRALALRQEQFQPAETNITPLVIGGGVVTALLVARAFL